jgi:nitrite reductase (NADH) large subunit
LGEAVTGIDREAKLVHGAKGPVPYDKLVIATGSAPVMLPLPGADQDGVIAYRDLEDTERMMALQPGQRAVVIGGGLLGLEAAAGMAARGVEVTVVHLMGHLMERQLDPEAGALLRASLEAKGITVLLEAASAEITGADGQVAGLRLQDGRHLPCDLLVMAVGIRPAVALAQEAGLRVDRGIVVDDQMRSSDPDILAVGECTEHRGTLFGLVAPLFDQAQVAAATLTGGSAMFREPSMSTKLKVTGCDLFSAGDFAEAEGRENILYRDPAHGVYKRLVIEGDRLVGAVLYGDTTDGPWFHRLISEAAPIGGIRSSRVFGPAYAEPEAA